MFPILNKKEVMKRISIYIEIIVSTVMLLSAAGCSFDERLMKPEKVVEGIPTKVTLGYGVDGSRVYTRAEQDAEYENQVDNLYILVFDALGNRIETTADDGSLRAFFGTGTGVDAGITGYQEYNDSDPENIIPTSGQIEFVVPSTNDATIVGIANLKNGNTSTAFNITRDELDAIENMEQLRDLVMAMPVHSVGRTALFMMTGYAQDKDGDTKVTIAGDEGGATTLEYSLVLRRVDAKVRVSIQADLPYDDFSFEPKTWRVRRVPAQSLLLPYDMSHETAGKAGPWEESEAVHWDASTTDKYECEYFDTEEMPFEEMLQGEREEENVPYVYGGQFSFYMPENRKRYKSRIETTGSEGYALREKRNTTEEGVTGTKPGQEWINTDFTYADPNSTYLEITGYLSYTDNDGKVVNADVRYTIHLGYYSLNANDYDTKRNGLYTYTIKIKGIDDLIVEVSNRNESRPGYEGDIVTSENEIYYLDSHYDRCLLEITPGVVNDNMTWSVKTPFSTGVHAVGEGYTGVEDFRWIKFSINKLAKKIDGSDYRHGEYVKYPGDGAYDENWKPAINEEVPGLLDIDQLIEYLKVVKRNDPEMTSLKTLDANGSLCSHVCITAFVEENLYIKDPRDGSDNLMLWKDMVDREDRQMHIITPTGDKIYSQDGNSSSSVSQYSFMQKSIRTIFNKDKSLTDLNTAWGLETVMEEVYPNDKNGDKVRLEPGDVRAGTSTSNGRWNTLQWIYGKGLRWSDIMNTSERYGLNDEYQTAAYACLLRNRDLNGDNIIQADEIRWYLAAIDQLTDIFIGEGALDQASRLYPDNRPGGKAQYWHYTTSSSHLEDYNNQQSTVPWILWAEEGASRGSYESSQKNNGTRYSYRCLRNLGIPLDTPDALPDSLITVKSNNDGSYILDLSRVNPKALRSSHDGGLQLPKHHERQYNNRPFTKFYVDKDVYGYDQEMPIYETRNGGKTNIWDLIYSTEEDATFNWVNKARWDEYNDLENGPCKSGRMPNQRELLIMTTRLSREQWPLIEASATYWVYVILQGEEQRTKYFSERPSVYISQTAFSLNKQYNYENRGGFIWDYGTNTFMLQNYDPDKDSYTPSESGYVRCVRDYTSSSAAQNK